MAAPDFEDLIKLIKPAASADNVAAATIALRLIRAQLTSGGISAKEVFDTSNNPTSDFKTLVDAIKRDVNSL